MPLLASPPSRPTFARTRPRLCRPSALPLSPVLFRCLPGHACSARPPSGPVVGALPPVPGVLVVGGLPDASASVRPPPSVCAGGGAGLGCAAFVGRAHLNDRAHKCARTGTNLQGLFYDISACAEKVICFQQNTHFVHVSSKHEQNLDLFCSGLSLGWRPPLRCSSGGVPLFPLRSPPIWNVYREFTTPDRACQGSPRRWRSDERPRPPLTAPFVSGFR